METSNLINRGESPNKGSIMSRTGSVTSKKKRQEMEDKGWIRYSVAKMRTVLLPKLIKEQAGTCAICPIALKSLPSSRVVIDHDHVTKVVRGALCDNCNRQIGVADKQKRTGDWYRAAGAFIDKSKADFEDESKQKYVYPEALPKGERRTAKPKKVVKRVVKKITKTATRH